MCGSTSRQLRLQSARATAVLSLVLLPSLLLLLLSESCLVERWDLDGRGVGCGRDLDGEEAEPICVAFALTRDVICYCGVHVVTH